MHTDTQTPSNLHAWDQHRELMTQAQASQSRKWNLADLRISHSQFKVTSASFLPSPLSHFNLVQYILLLLSDRQYGVKHALCTQRDLVLNPSPTTTS